jgi:hypothetical protein
MRGIGDRSIVDIQFRRRMGIFFDGRGASNGIIGLDKYLETTGYLLRPDIDTWLCAWS